MGAIAEGFVAFAQPLLDQTDGSLEQMQKAMSLSQLCFNLALLDEDRRETSIREMQPELQMSDKEFHEFRSSIIDPMIRRHHEMFPLMHKRAATAPPLIRLSPQASPRMAAQAETPAVIDRYAPCPCNSGEKYKFCCGAKRR